MEMGWWWFVVDCLCVLSLLFKIGDCLSAMADLHNQVGLV